MKTMEKPTDRYGGGESMPLKDFALLMGVFSCGLGASLYWLGRNRRLPDRWPRAREFFFLALANHKLAWLVSSDQVTSVLRSPFARYEEPAGKGSVKEHPRGQGLRRAVGELLTCPWCTGMWTAAALTTGYLAFPRPTRALATILAVDVATDYLHVSWSRSKDPGTRN